MRVYKIKSTDPIGKKIKESFRQRRQPRSVFAVSIITVIFLSVTLPVSESTAGEVWVANMKGANVQIIDTDSNEVVKTIPTGAGAHNVTFSPDGKIAISCNVGAGNVTFIDVASKKAIHTMPTGKKAITAVFSPGGRKVYVVNAGDANISVIDMNTRQVSKTLTGAKGAMAIKPTDDWGLFWLTAPVDNKLLLMNPRTGSVEAEIDVPGEPHGLVISPDGKTVYVGQRGLNQIAKIDTASRNIVKTTPLGQRPDMMAISSDGKTVYVAIRDENKLAVVSASDLSLTTKIGTDGETHGVAYRD